MTRETDFPPESPQLLPRDFGGLASQPHYHKDETGFIRACYHRCRHWLSPKFLAGFFVSQMIGFPFEHWLYEKVWPFTVITHWLGL